MIEIILVFSKYWQRHSYEKDYTESMHAWMDRYAINTDLFLDYIHGTV